MPEIAILPYMITAASYGFDWYHVFKDTVNLLLFILVLGYFSKGIVMKYLQSRRDNLGKEIDDARKAVEDAKKKYGEYEDKLRTIDSEIKSLRESILKQAELEKTEIIKQAEKTAEVIKRDTRESITIESVKLKKELEEEFIKNTLGEAERLITARLSDTGTGGSVDHFIKKVEEEKWLQ